MNQTPLEFWSLPAAELLAKLRTTPNGVTSDEAKEATRTLWLQSPDSQKKIGLTCAFTFPIQKSHYPQYFSLRQDLSLFLHEHVDVFIILAIVFHKRPSWILAGARSG